MTAAPSGVLRRPISFQPNQMGLLTAILDRRPDSACIIGFGGPRGGSKSGGIRRCAVALATGCEKQIVWIIRRVWDDLNKNHVLKMWEDFPELKQFYHAGEKKLSLPNGSTIFFIHAGDAGRSKRKQRGPEAHYIFLDQAEEFSQAEMEQMEGSNRGTGVAPGYCKRIYTFNPGGIGAAYLRRVFHLKEFRDNERPENFVFLRSNGWDNFEWFRGLNMCTEWEFYHSEEWDDSRRFKIFVEKTDFGRGLNSLPPSQRIGELMGDFESFAGQYYSEVWEQKIIVLPVDICQRIIKPWWPRWLAIDWGFSHYAACGWATSGLLTVEEIADYFGVQATAPVRVLLVYREAVVCDTQEPDLARLLSAMTPDPEKRELRYIFIGHDAWAKRGSANTVVEQMDPIFQKAGMPRLCRADIDRVGGWRLLYNCFASARRFRLSGGSPFEEHTEDPPALFISGACTEIQSAVPLLMSDYDPITNPRGNPQDVKKVAGQVEDDVGDMLRYAIKSYLTAEPGLPKDVAMQETYQKYQDPTARAMAMLRLNEKNEKKEYIRRRRRM